MYLIKLGNRFIRDPFSHFILKIQREKPFFIFPGNRYDILAPKFDTVSIILLWTLRADPYASFLG